MQIHKVYYVESSKPIEVNGELDKHSYFGLQATIYSIFFAE